MVDATRRTILTTTATGGAAAAVLPAAAKEVSADMVWKGVDAGAAFSRDLPLLVELDQELQNITTDPEKHGAVLELLRGPLDGPMNMRAFSTLKRFLALGSQSKIGLPLSILGDSRKLLTETYAVRFPGKKIPADLLERIVKLPQTLTSLFGTDSAAAISNSLDERLTNRALAHMRAIAPLSREWALQMTDNKALDYLYSDLKSDDPRFIEMATLDDENFERDQQEWLARAKEQDREWNQAQNNRKLEQKAADKKKFEHGETVLVRVSIKPGAINDDEVKAANNERLALTDFRRNPLLNGTPFVDATVLIITPISDYIPQVRPADVSRTVMSLSEGVELGDLVMGRDFLVQPIKDEAMTFASTRLVTNHPAVKAHFKTTNDVRISVRANRPALGQPAILEPTIPNGLSELRKKLTSSSPR